MSQLSDALIKFETAQAKRIADEAELTKRATAAQSASDAFNKGAIRTVGSVIIPAAAKQVMDQMQGAIDSTQTAVESQKVVVSQDYADEQAANQTLVNIARNATNFGAVSIL